MYAMESVAQSSQLLLQEGDYNDLEQATNVNKQRWKSRTAFSSMLLFSAMVLSFLGAAWTLSSGPPPAMTKRPFDDLQPQTCSRPRTRREWRSLTTRERKDYISAVMCLYRKPSQLRGQGSLLDDLTWVHIKQNAHDRALFLPWHRMFLHVYEQHLRDYCGFQGQLPYWDWTTDWQNLGNSSMWDDETGFGGEANNVSNTGCVTGPFGNIQVLYTHNGSIVPHCLSRRFNNYKSGEGGTISGDPIRPSAMKRLARAKSYGTFRYMLEGLAHNFFHYQVDGDLKTSAAPNDPLFWLHHTQLDRLWWLWQEKNASARHQDYSESKQQPSSSGSASLTDALQYGGLAGTTQVGDVMRTESGPLCYRYTSVT